MLSFNNCNLADMLVHNIFLIILRENISRRHDISSKMYMDVNMLLQKCVAYKCTFQHPRFPIMKL